MTKLTDTIRADYDSWHESLSLREPEGNVLSKVWYQKVRAALPNLNGLRVLEIGCGRGEFSAYVHSTYPKANLIAADFSAGAIEVCKRRFQPSSTLQFRVEDATKLSFNDEQFDVVICCETLEHIPEVHKAVKEISRVLKNGGEFFITTPSYLNAYAIVWLKCWLLNKPFESGQGIQPFEHFYTSRFVRSLFRQSRLKVDKSTSSHFQWLVFPRIDPAKLRTVEFRRPLFNRLFRPFGIHFFYQGHKAK
jgi:ubiquinone/menaquinone biosynthesis C-methylase UbiE